MNREANTHTSLSISGNLRPLFYLRLWSTISQSILILASVSSSFSSFCLSCTVRCLIKWILLFHFTFVCFLIILWVRISPTCAVHSFYYAALLPRRGPHIASHSVCPSVCLSVCPSVCPSVPLSLLSIGNVFSSTASVTDVLFGTHWGPHIVRPSRPHKFLLQKQHTEVIGSCWHAADCN